MNHSEDKLRDQNLDVKKLIQLFQENEQAQRDLENKDMILLVGPTGSGKSTTANYLLGLEMFFENVETCYEIDGVSYSSKDKVIASKGGFQIGHSKQSHTSTLQIAHLKGSYFLCDSPGFFDNRGAEIEITNASSLKQFMLNCNSVKVVVLTSYHELVAQRGALFQETFNLVTRILKNPEKESFEKITFLFTNVPNEKKVDAIVKEILDFLKIINNEEDIQSQMMKSFLKVILNQINDNNNAIVNPVDGNHELLLQKILNHQSFTNPSEEFCFSVSEKANQKLQLYVEETNNLVVKLQYKGLYREIMEKMVEFKQISDYTGDEYLLNSYQDLLNEIVRIFEKQKNLIFNTFCEASEKSNIFSNQNMNEILEIIQHLNVIDGFKDKIFEEGQFKTSENQFKQEIEAVCFQMGQRITKDFPQNIENVKNNLQKLKDFSDQTSLGYQIFNQIQKEIRDKYLQQIKDLKELSNNLYIRPKQLDVNSINDNVAEIAQKIGFIKLIEEFLRAFILEGEEDFYKTIVQIHLEKNKELIQNLKGIMDNINEQITKQSGLFDSHIGLNFEIAILPDFEINMLKIQNQNIKYSEYLPECKNLFNQALLYLKEFIQQVFNFIKENTQDDFHLYNLQNILKTLDQIRNQDDLIFEKTADEYKQIKNEIKEKIQKKASEAKRILNQYLEENEEVDTNNDSNLEEDFSDMNSIKSSGLIKSIWQSQKKNVNKLWKAYNYLHNMIWTDDYFQTKFTQNSIKKLVDKLNQYFEHCKQNILNFIENDEFYQIKQFLNRMKCLSDFKDVVTNYQQQYEVCIDSVKKRVLFLSKGINDFISSIQIEGKMFDTIFWGDINQNIMLLLKIQTLDMIDGAKEQSFSQLNTIYRLIQEYFEKNFQKIENLAKPQVYINMVDFNIYTSFIKNAKLISRDYQHIESVLKGYSFNALTDLVQKVYDDQVIDYTFKKELMDNLQEIQSSYDAIKRFVYSMSEFDFLKNQFKSLPTPKETIQETFKNLEKMIKNEDFQSLDSEIQLLSQLQSVKDKQTLDKLFQKLYDRFYNEIQQVNINYNFKKNGDFSENVRKNLKIISQILRVFNKYNTELYQISQKELNDFMISFRNIYMKSQKQIIFSKIKQFKFQEVEQQYQQLMQTFSCLGEFKQIFQQEDWNTYSSEIQNIKEEIQKLFLSIQNTSDLKQLLNLLQELLGAQSLHSDFTEIFQEEIKNTIETIQSVFKNQEISIRDKIKNQNNVFKSELKNLKDFAQKAEKFEQLNNCEFQFKIFQIDEEVNEELNRNYQEISSLLVNKEYKMAIRQLNKIKQVNEQFFNKLIKKMQNMISQAVNQIQDQFPSIEVSSFKINFETVCNNMVVINYLGNEEMWLQFQTVINNLISNIFAQSRKLFEECDKILMSNNQLFTYQNIYNLFKHHSFFQVIQTEMNQTERSQNLYQIYKIIIDKIIEGLQKVHQVQQLIKEKMQVDKTFNKNWKKFNALHELIKNQPQLFDQSNELKKIKEIGLKILNYEQLLRVIKQNFDKSEQDFAVALEDCDFQRVKEIIFIIRKYSNINQYFNTEFINVSFMLKQIEQKVNQITLEALNTVKASIFYDQKMNNLMQQIYKADEHLNSIDQYPYEPKIQIVLKELANKLDQEISNFQTFMHYQLDLKEIGQFLISIQKISEQVSKFTQIADQKLFKAIEIIIQMIGEEFILELGHILKEDASGAQIVNKIPQFKSFKIDKLNELLGKHDINYILGKLQQQERDNKKQNIGKQLKQDLKNYYDTYLQKYDEIIQKYKYQKHKWNEIVEQVKLFSKQINLPTKKGWNEKSAVLHLLAQICAYWTLVDSGEQKQGKKDIFKKPNHTQIISIIMLLGIHRETGFWQGVKNYFSQGNQMEFKNQLIEILTGEGKSITLGFCSIMLALMDCEVDVICYSNYLSERDDKDFRKFFNSFGVSEKIKYGTFKQQAERYLESYLDVRQNTLNIINQSMQNNLKNSIQISKSYKILLIDEVDLFFNLDYYGKTYNPSVSFDTQEIKGIIEDIWNYKGQQESKIIANIEQSSNYKELINKYPKYEKLFQRHIQKLAQNVNQVEKHKKNKNYVVRNNQIGYRQKDSTISFTSRYGYLTLYAYFLEHSKGNIDDQTLQKEISLNLNCGHISYALLPDTYSAILGVTGTLQSLNQQMKQSLIKYKFSTQIYIPSMFGDSKLDFREGDMVKVEIDLENQYLKIQEISSQAVQQNQSVLIFFKDSQSLTQYHKSNYLYISKEKYIVVTDHESSEDFNFQVQKVTRSGQIGLFVREYGRGTDFISLDPNVIKSGGVVVIQTFLSDSKTEEIQIKGRTARQGQQGQYYLILNQEDLIKDFSLENDQIQQWKNNQNKKSLYANLIEVRDAQENNMYQNIENNIKQAADDHQKSIKYIQNIKNQNYDQAIEYINENS